MEADETLTLARSLMGKDPTTFVASDHGFAPQFLAIDASKVARRPRPAVQAADLELPPGDRRDHRQGQGLLGRRHRPDLPQPRRPRSRRRRPFKQVAAADVAATVATIKAAFLGLTDPNDWTHDGQPEGWKVIDRAFTKAEARYIPNGPGSTADMAHPTRTGDLVVFSYPPYQFDAATPGTLDRAVALLRPARLRAGRPGPRRQRQHAGDVPRRRQGHRRGPGHRPDHRPRPDARLHPRHPRAAAQPGPGPARRGQGRLERTSPSRSSA